MENRIPVGTGLGVGINMSFIDPYGRQSSEYNRYPTSLLEDDVGTVQFNFTRWDRVIAQITSVIANEESLGDSFILGHATNGTLGPANGNVLGRSGTVVTLNSHVNLGNIWKEHLLANTYIDTTNTTATIDYDTGVASGAATSTVYLYTKDIYYQSGVNIDQVKVSSQVEVTPGASTITWQASTDEGSVWTTFTSGAFANVPVGDTLRVRATLTAPAADIPYIQAGQTTPIKIEYKDA